jgi:tetratricopeptide (TPR) repeat protein
MKRSLAALVLIGLFMVWTSAPALAAVQAPTKPQAAQAAPPAKDAKVDQKVPAKPTTTAQKPADVSSELPPELKAYQEAVKISDPDKKIEALKKVITDNPKSSIVDMAENQILSTLIKRATDTLKAVQDQAKKMSDADVPGGRSTSGPIASALLNANLMLGDAETYAKKAVDNYSDEATFIAAQKKTFAERQAEAQKKDPTAKPMTMPDDATLASGFKTMRQTALVTLAQVYDKRGKAPEAEKAFKDAYTLAPRGSSAATAALKLAEYAKKAGRTSEQFEYLTVVALTGRLTASDRTDFEGLYKQAHNGSLDGLEDMLDARYAKENPPNVHVKPYVATKDRTKRVVLAEVFTGSGCPPCAGADLAYDGAMERYKQTELAVLMYHMHIPRPDPMANTYSIKRADFYAIRGVPTAVVDGEAKIGGGSADAAPKIYSETVEPAIEKRLTKAPGATLALKVEKKGNTITTKVAVGKTPATAKKLRLHVVLAEERIRYSGENGVRFHPMVVRSIAMSDKDTQGWAVAPGRNFKTTYVFDVQKTMDEAKAHLDDFEVNNTRFGKFQFATKKHAIDGDTLYVVAFVQDEDSKEILQSAILKTVSKKK